MQQLAKEIGFSETVFVLPPEAGGHARIRIFNPVYEMDFAGHPTLGAAFVLGAPLQLGVITLETGAGPVPVVLERDETGRIVFGRMQQPVPGVSLFGDPDAAIAAVGATGSTLPVELYDNGARQVIVTFSSVAELASLRPDTDAIASFGITGINCIALDGERRPEPHVLAERRGSGDRLGGRPDRMPSLPPRARRLGLGDRDRSGRRDGAALRAPRTRRRR